MARRAGRCTTNIPSGTAINMAITMEISTSSTCSNVAPKISARCSIKKDQALKPALMPALPDQFQAKPQTPALPDAQVAETLAEVRPQQSAPLLKAQSATRATALPANRASRTQSFYPVALPARGIPAAAPRASPDREPQTARPSAESAGRPPMRAPRPRAAAARPKVRAAVALQIRRAPAPLA